MTCTVHLDLATLPSFLFYLDWDCYYDLYPCSKDFSIRLHHARGYSFDFLLKFPHRSSFDKALIELTSHLPLSTVHS